MKAPRFPAPKDSLAAAAQPAIQPQPPIIHDASFALMEFAESFSRVVDVIETNTLDLWDLLDCKCFKAENETDQIRSLRNSIVRLATRHTVAHEALIDHLRTIKAIDAAVPLPDGGAA